MREKGTVALLFEGRSLEAAPGADWRDKVRPGELEQCSGAEGSGPGGPRKGRQPHGSEEWAGSGEGEGGHLRASSRAEASGELMGLLKADLRKA